MHNVAGGKREKSVPVRLDLQVYRAIHTKNQRKETVLTEVWYHPSPSGTALRSHVCFRGHDRFKFKHRLT